MSNVEGWRRRVGLADAERLPARRGVVADWGALPSVLSPLMGDLALREVDVSSAGAGVAVQTPRYGRDERLLVVEVDVASSAAGAVDRLVQLASTTMRVDIPFDKSPTPIGEVSVLSRAGRTMLLLHANICVQVTDHEKGGRLVPISQAIDAFAREHLVEALAIHLPRVGSVLITPPRPKVGQTVLFTVPQPRPPGSADYLPIVIRPLPGRDRDGQVAWRLEPSSTEGLEGEFQVVAPGPAAVEVEIIRRKDAPVAVGAGGPGDRTVSPR